MATAAQPPKRGLPGGGWLSMAPPSEDRQPSPPAPHSQAAVPSTTSVCSQYALPRQRTKSTSCSSSSASLSRSPSRGVGRSSRSTYAHPYAQDGKRATFTLGSGGDDDGTSTINTPISPTSQDGSGMLSPVFDARASFAPLVFKKPAAQQQQAPVTQQPSGSQRHSPLSQEHDSASDRASSNLSAVTRHAGTAMDVDDDGKGIYFAGRKWKGKTAHAVEQEMEKVGDVSVMSYAPDAVYLASRLHGLQRNLEAGGEEARGRRWLDYGEGEDDDGDAAARKEESGMRVEAAEGGAEPHAKAPHVDVKSTASAGVGPTGDDTAAQETAPIARERDDRIPATLPPHITDLIPRPSPPTISLEQPRLDPAAKAAALDSRVEIRLLRRSDLEQVRDLHCLHGDNDKVDAEHYVTSAAFLLRLLVDESYVCLVAVAKPLPEPETSMASVLQQGGAGANPALIPRCPPPSMDMPPTAAPYVFAGKGISSTSPLLGPIDVPSQHSHRRHRAPRSKLSQVSSAPLGAMAEADDDDGGGNNDDEEMQDASSEDSDAELSDAADDSRSVSPSDDGDSSGSRGHSQSANDTSLFSSSPRDEIRRARASTAATTATGASLAPADAKRSFDERSTSSMSASSSGMAPKRDYSAAPVATTAAAAAATPPITNGKGEEPPTTDGPPAASMVLTGPTNDVAPPRALRVMVPPAPGAALESETILGVASCHVRMKPATESLWGPSDPSSSLAHKEIHVLTLSVARAERGLGLGGRLLDQVIEEAHLRRNVGSAYRAQLGRRTSSSSKDGYGPTRTYLEVHPDSSQAIALYKSRKFDETSRVRGYFRGDVRIPTGVRSLPGGSDALLFERHEHADGGGGGGGGADREARGEKQ
ncbi:unnamed protein product [Jaminaea pallidilutea]